jgi:lathosterol oxidase
VILGAAGVGAVLCLWYPALLTTPALRDVYDMRLIRGLIKAGLIAAFVLGAASLLLKRRKALGLTGVGLAALATLMGGSAVEVATPVRPSDYLGLDWSPSSRCSRGCRHSASSAAAGPPTSRTSR